MYHILLSNFNFDEAWCYEKIKPYLRADQRVVVMPLTFDRCVDTSEKWLELYAVGKKYYELITRPFQSFQYDVSQFHWINPFEMTKERIIEQLAWSDLLILPGGFPDLQMKRMESLGIVDELRYYYGDVIGVSSGAMTQLPIFYLSPDQDYNRPVYNLKGIGMIDLNAQVEVHFDATNVLQFDALKVVCQTENVIAIGEKGCFIVEHDQIEAIGDVTFFEKESVR